MLFNSINVALQKIDVFSQMPNFRILGKQKFSTTIGIIMTILIFCLSIIFFITQFVEILSQTSPTIRQTEKQVGETSEYPLFLNNFTIAVGMADLNYEPISDIEKYFSISIQNCHFVRSINTTTGNMEVDMTCLTFTVEECTSAHFPSVEQQNFFTNIRLNRIRCINLDELKSNTPYLQGLQQSLEFSTLSISITKCQNTTNIICATSEQIEEYYNQGYYIAYQSDNLIQTIKPGNVSYNVMSLQYTTFSLSTSKQIFQNYKIVEVQTDNVFYFTNTEIDQYLIQNNYRESNDFYNGNYILTHTITLDSKQTVINRSYQSVLSMLGNVGGLYSMLFLIFNVLIKPLIITLMEISMSNEIFHFESSNHNTPTLPMDNSEAVDAVVDIVKSSRQSNVQSHIKNKMIQKTLSQIFEKKNLKMLMTFKQIVFLMFGCDIKRKKQLSIAEQQIYNQLDVANIIKKLFEIDKLKYILLSNDQRILFDCLPKPVIKISSSLDDQSLKYSFFQQYLFSNKPQIFINNAYESFKNIIKQKKMNKIDRALFRCLDSDVKSLFQQVTFELQDQNEKMNSSIEEDNYYFRRKSRQQNSKIKNSYKKNDHLSISVEGIPQPILTNHRELNQLIQI